MLHYACVLNFPQELYIQEPCYDIVMTTNPVKCLFCPMFGRVRRLFVFRDTAGGVYTPGGFPCSALVVRCVRLERLSHQLCSSVTGSRCAHDQPLPRGCMGGPSVACSQLMPVQSFATFLRSHFEHISIISTNPRNQTTN